MNYTDENFDITTIPSFNSIEGFIEISNYLDFALSTTIHRQFPNITPEGEKYYAAEKIKLFINQEDVTVFSRQFGIRDNVIKIGKDKIKFLICKHLIELHAYNVRINHMLNPTQFIDQAAQYVAQQVASSNLSEIDYWIDQNINIFIDSYISKQYKSAEKKQLEVNALQHPVCSKALEQLNLELHLQQAKQK